MPRDLKNRLAAGGRLCGTMVFEFFTPGIGQLCASAGAEFIIFDMEHSAAGTDTIRAQFAYCRGLDTVPLVRVPTADYHFIARMLDAGAKGIMVPMVESAEQAQAIVRAVRYPPDGRRGAAFGVAHDDFRGGDVGETMREANARNLVIAQIETERGLAAVEAIAATPGIDVLWLGHFDMTNFLGIAGGFDDPAYRAAVEAIVAAARRHGKALGFMAADAAWARDYAARGFTMIAYGLDHQIYQRALSDGIATLRSLET
jgi:2-keto-3-deoxy-L-rhamnonate aldolase RhmA